MSFHPDASTIPHGGGGWGMPPPAPRMGSSSSSMVASAAGASSVLPASFSLSPNATTTSLSDDVALDPLSLLSGPAGAPSLVVAAAPVVVGNPSYHPLRPGRKLEAIAEDVAAAAAASPSLIGTPPPP